MLPKLSELEEKCSELGLALPADTKLKKSDYVKILREHYLPNNGLPYIELTPALAFPSWNLKSEELEEAWNSDHWVAQEKLDGCRAVVHFVAGKGVYIHSRTISRKTYRYQELHQQVLFHDHVPDFSATVDCEAMVTKPIDTRGYTTKGEVTKSGLHSTVALLHLDGEQSRRLQEDQQVPLVFQAFDITSIDGNDLRNLPLRLRLSALEDFKTRLRHEVKDFFKFPTYYHKGKKSVYNDIVNSGGEGVLLKNLDYRYVDSSSRPRNCWVKVKRRQEYDAFVTGFERGDEKSAWRDLVGVLEFSVVDKATGKQHVIGHVSSFTMQEREAMTEILPGNKVALNKKWYNKVGQISGQDISPRSKTLTHCVLDRWRVGVDGTQPSDCTVNLKDLK